MNSLLLTSPSSVNSSTTTTTTTTSSAAAAAAMSDDQSETRDSCYFPKCRKDANCNCEMCLASINATLDLMPKSSLTKNSISERVPTRRSPISFNPSVMSTPISLNPSVMSTPKSTDNPITVSRPVNSRAGIGRHGKSKKKKKSLGIGFMLLRLVLGLSLVFLADRGFSWAVFRVLKPRLSPEIVRDFGEKSRVLEGVHEKVEFLHREIKSLINGKIADCSSGESVWKINQDDLLLNSGCTVYKSSIEEVRIWGWPLQTAGLLTAGFSSRSLTILSGRVTEWSDGKLSYTTRNANETWVQQKWSASVVQLDPNTWILEYRSTGIVDNSRIVSAMLRFIKFRLSREVKRMKQEFWLCPAFGDQYNDFTRDSFKVPT